VSDQSDTTSAGQAPAAQALDPGREAADLDTEETGVFAAYDRLSWGWKILALAALLGTILIILTVWHDFYFHWFEVHTGTVNESGPYYGFWSGFGSDIGEATLVVGIFAVWRHHSCHVRGCARLGRPVAGTPYIACPKHHPEHKGSRRTVSIETIQAAHDANANRSNRS
jgi:hypothetical protein